MKTKPRHAATVCIVVGLFSISFTSAVAYICKSECDDEFMCSDGTILVDDDGEFEGCSYDGEECSGTCTKVDGTGSSPVCSYTGTQNDQCDTTAYYLTCSKSYNAECVTSQNPSYNCGCGEFGSDQGSHNIAKCSNF